MLPYLYTKGMWKEKLEREKELAIANAAISRFRFS